MQKPISGFRCPSDTSPEVNNEHTLRDVNDVEQEVASSNYLGVHDGDYWSNVTGEQHQGTFFANTNRSFRDYTDGLSNTIVVGERNWKLNDNGGGNGNCHAGVIFGTDGDASVMRGRTIIAIGRFGINPLGTDSGSGLTVAECARGFSSNHTGGAHFLLGDGAVRFISENIENDPDPTDGNENFLFQNLLNRNDGNPIGQF